MSERGHLFVIAAPSGAGKTSLVRALTERVDQLEISISYTTRQPRPGDVDGQDYFFVTEAEFKALLAKQAFLEHATIYDHYYATSKQWVSNQLVKGIDVVLEIDWQGAKQIHQLMPDSVLVFVLPPSMDALQHRLQQRQQDDAAVIAQRMAGAQQEMSHYAEFDYLIVNECFEDALTALEHIVRSKRLCFRRQQALHMPLLQQLLKK